MTLEMNGVYPFTLQLQENCILHDQQTNSNIQKVLFKTNVSSKWLHHKFFNNNNNNNLLGNFHHITVVFRKVLTEKLQHCVVYTCCWSTFCQASW